MQSIFVLLFGLVCPMQTHADDAVCTPVNGCCEWRQHQQDPAWLGCFVNGVQVGAFHRDTETYRSYDAQTNTWGPPQAPPWKPARPNLLKEPGMEWRPNGEGERVTLNGHAISKADALTVLGSAVGIPNDKDALALTFIDADQKRRKAVRRDFESSPEFAAVKELIKIQDYDPSDWAVSSGHVKDGKPTIYLQAPGGKTLFRLDRYPGAEFLAECIQTSYGKLRKPDPSYDPAKDPNPMLRPLLRKILRLPPMFWLLVILTVVFGIGLLRRTGGR